MQHLGQLVVRLETIWVIVTRLTIDYTSVWSFSSSAYHPSRFPPDVHAEGLALIKGKRCPGERSRKIHPMGNILKR